MAQHGSLRSHHVARRLEVGAAIHAVRRRGRQLLRGPASPHLRRANGTSCQRTAPECAGRTQVIVLQVP